MPVKLWVILILAAAIATYYVGNFLYWELAKMG